MLAISTTISSTGQNSYRRGRILSGNSSPFTRFGARASESVEAGMGASRDGLRLRPGESGSKIGFVGEEGRLAGPTFDVDADGAGSSLSTFKRKESAGSGSIMKIVRGLH
jgi:hypothetical protein